MKTILFSIFIVLLLCVGCSDQKKTKINKETDLEKMNLNGKLQSIQSTSYKAIKKFGEIVPGKVDGLFTQFYYIVFNKDGNIVEKNTTFESDGFYDFKKTIEYNNKGRKIKHNYYSNDSLSGKTTYQYGKNGNIIKRNENNPDGTLSRETIYKYDKKGNMLEISFYKSDSLTGRRINKYDEEGNRIEISVYNSNGSLSRKRKFEYDKQRKMVEENRYAADGSLNEKITYKYNEKGDIIEEKSTGYGSSTRRTYTYKYDNNGNWKTKFMYFKNLTSDPIFIIKRDIVYFND